MRKLVLHPLFLLGLTIRLVLIFMLQPLAVTEWYMPFLDASTNQFTLDPWAIWLDQGGDIAAFPYGYVMWVALLPLTLLFKLFGISLFYGYVTTLLIADFSLLAALRKLLPKCDRLLLVAYWLSPIVLLATYGLGLNDLIPVLLLALSLYFTRKRRLFVAGFLCIAAISAKLSMVLALPFYFIYLNQNRALHQISPGFLKGVLAGAALFIFPFIISGSGLHMLISNPLMDNVYQFSLSIGDGTKIYVVPLAYLLMIYATFRIRRLNFDLFQSILGLSFLLVVLLTPASPGWFIWALPLLVTYQAMSGRVAVLLSGVFSGLYVLSTLLLAPEMTSLLSRVTTELFDSSREVGGHTISVVHTAMTAIGIVLAVRIWREMVSRNDYFRLSRKPLVLGIAGDAGTGKETFSNAIEGLFGSHSVTKLSGNNYRLWDRQKPMWQVMTNLNPMANDLECFANDLVALSDGKSVPSRKHNHLTGKASRPFQLNSNDFIIVNGLHALYLPILRSCYNLSIYLEVDESLRRYFRLQRDVVERGGGEAKVQALLEKELPDSIQFVQPQVSHADLVLSLQPIHPRILDDSQYKHPIRLKLIARSKNGLNEISLTRVLVGVCGLHVDMIMKNDASGVELVIEGEASSDDIALAAKILCPRILDFLDICPKWKDGVLGLMQLITLSHVNQVLTKRFI